LCPQINRNPKHTVQREEIGALTLEPWSRWRSQPLQPQSNGRRRGRPGGGRRKPPLTLASLPRGGGTTASGRRNCREARGGGAAGGGRGRWPWPAGDGRRAAETGQLADAAARGSPSRRSRLVLLRVKSRPQRTGTKQKQGRGNDVFSPVPNSER